MIVFLMRPETIIYLFRTLDLFAKINIKQLAGFIGDSFNQNFDADNIAKPISKANNKRVVTPKIKIGASILRPL